jgi:GcrA cell cycle regulator
MFAGLDASAWTDERVALLRKLWGDGLSASQISTELNCGITRNGVIGKVHRLGLSGRKKQVRGPRPEISNPGLRDDVRARNLLKLKAAPSLQPDHPLTAKHKPKTGAHHGGDHGQGALNSIRSVAETDDLADGAEATDLPNEQTATAVSFFERQPHQCAHPIGNPQDLETFRFCGAQRRGSDPYCAAHCRMNYGAQPRVQLSFAERQRRAVQARANLAARN